MEAVKTLKVRALSSAYDHDTHAQLRWLFCLLLDEFQADGCLLNVLTASAYRICRATAKEAKELAFSLVAAGFAVVDERSGEALFKPTEKHGKLCRFEIAAPANIARPAEPYC
ncbi:MAG: hypothetical protein ACFB0C_19620 [Leptolyngbyaceae cyanobacterium]